MPKTFWLPLSNFQDDRQSNKLVMLSYSNFILLDIFFPQEGYSHLGKSFTMQICLTSFGKPPQAAPSKSHSSWQVFSASITYLIYLWIRIMQQGFANRFLSWNTHNKGVILHTYIYTECVCVYALSTLTNSFKNELSSNTAFLFFSHTYILTQKHISINFYFLSIASADLMQLWLKAKIFLYSYAILSLASIFLSASE